MAQKINSSIMSFAIVAFVLLGILFGMNIMTFLFGNLSANNDGIFPLESITTVNETQAWINSSGYTVDTVSQLGATSYALVNIWSSMCATCEGVGSDGVYNYSIGLGNASISSAGVILNLTTFNTTLLSNVSIIYTNERFTSQRIAADEIANNSLQSIGTYTNQSDTQFSTVSIAITLIILLAVFAFFWKFFIGSQSGRGRKESAGNF